MESSSPQQRLLQLAEQRGASLSQLSRLIDRNPSYLQQFVRKGSPRKLGETDRRTLAQFFGIDEGELGAPEEISSSIMENERNWINLPRLALGASAGSGAVLVQEEAIGAFRFSARWLRERGFDAKQLSAIAVTGDSMEPTLRDGDEILVDRSPAPLRDGIHVVRLDDALLVKRTDTSRPDRITLISDNPSYRPIEISSADIEVIGRVVWKSGRL